MSDSALMQALGACPYWFPLYVADTAMIYSLTPEAATQKLKAEAEECPSRARSAFSDWHYYTTIGVW